MYRTSLHYNRAVHHGKVEGTVKVPAESFSLTLVLQGVLPSNLKARTLHCPLTYTACCVRVYQGLVKSSPVHNLGISFPDKPNSDSIELNTDIFCSWLWSV